MIAFETDHVPPEVLPQPAGWRILLAPVKLNDTTKGGIVLVEDTLKHAEYFRNVGKVVGVGREAYKHPKFNGGISLENRDPEPWVQIGDIVHYSSFTGMDIKIIHDGEEIKLKLCNDDEVISIIRDTSVLGLD